MTSGVQDEAESTTTLFSSSRRLAIADHFRVPHDVAGVPACPGVERLRTHRGADLLWASFAGDAELAPAERVEIASGPGIPIFAPVVAEATVERLLAECGGSWSRVLDLAGEDGERCGSIWGAGRQRLPAVRSGRGVLRTTGASATSRSPEPRSAPVEAWPDRRLLRDARAGCRAPCRSGCVAAMRACRRARVSAVAGRDRAARFLRPLHCDPRGGVRCGPVPRIAPGRDGHTWALVLTHDVEMPGVSRRSIRS